MIARAVPIRAALIFSFLQKIQLPPKDKIIAVIAMSFVLV